MSLDSTVRDLYAAHDHWLSHSWEPHELAGTFEWDYHMEARWMLARQVLSKYVDRDLLAAEDEPDDGYDTGRAHLARQLDTEIER